MWSRFVTSPKGWKVWNRIGKAAAADAALLQDMRPAVEELWRMLRYLSDLRAVWPSLTAEQQAEIEASNVYQQDFHAQRAQDRVLELSRQASGLRSQASRQVRSMILEFLDGWQNAEPDRLKVVLALIDGSDGG